MAHKMTIEIPASAYAALQAAAASASRTPEELAAEAISERFSETSEEAPEPPRLSGKEAREAILAVMRARGHLAEPLPVPQFPDADPLPPYGTPERAAFEEELWEELGEAFTKSGLSILDLVERR